MPSTSDPGTTAPQASPNPLGDATASEDQVGLALNAIATQMFTSVALFALVTWGTVQLVWASGVTDISQVTPDDPAAWLASFGTIGIILVVAWFGWFLLAPVRSPFRRFGVAMVGTLGGTVLAVVATSSARWALAAQGLLLLLVLAALLAWFFFRRTRAAARALPSSRDG